jgi:hypothetical protein
MRHVSALASCGSRSSFAWKDRCVSDVSVQHARNARSSVPVRLFAVTVAVLALLVATALYFRVGWWRMESACSLDNGQGSTHNSVSYGWSWQPLGFQCTYDNGETDTSLWF